MPNATAGKNITSADQINAGVVGSSEITDDSIVNADIKSDAAIDKSKLSGVAGSGANTDITSLANLSTPLTVEQGGLETNTLAAHGVMVGNGAGAPTMVMPSTAGYVLMDNGASADPSFQAPAASAWLLKEKVTSGGLQNLTSGTLDGDTDVVYEIIAKFESVHAGNETFDIVFNADGTAGNYYNQILTASSTTLAGARANSNRLFSTIAQGTSITIRATIMRESGGRWRMLGTITETTQSALVLKHFVLDWVTANNLTSFQIAGGEAGSFDSTARLYILKAGFTA